MYLRKLSSSIPLLLLLFSYAWADVVFTFDPLLTSEATYDDNIYLTRSNTRSDWITTVSPGFITSLSHPRLNFTLEYKPGFVYFLHNPQHDYTRYEDNFTGSIKLTSRLTLSLYQAFLRANEPDLEEFVGTEYQRDLRRSTRSIFNRNTVAPQLEYRFGSESFIKCYYRNTNYRSEDPLEDDYRENFIEGELEHWLNVRNGIRLLSHFTKGNFDNDSDLLNSIDLTLRYMHRLTPHFELYGEYGAGVSDFEERRYYARLDERREYIVDSEDVEDYDLRKFNVGFEWRLPRNVRIEGSMGYFWREGVGSRDDQGINSLLEIEKIVRDLAASIRWESGYSASFFAVRDAGFSKFWSISLNTTYRYHERLEFRCSGSYGYDEFTYGRGGLGFALEDREDYTYTAHTFLSYNILKNYFFLQDLSFEMEYRHIELDSNFITDYYIDNRYMMRLVVTF